MNKINKLLYIITFIALYLGTALVSTLHAVEFFSVSNVSWIAVLLAVCFEVGQAAVLFSILTTKANRKKFMPWALMGILTTVQIIGNVFASYKYIMMHSIGELKYFKEPIFIWTNLPDEQSTVIMTYISASILPIVALALTAMITSFLDDGENVSEITEKVPVEEIPVKEIAPEKMEENSENVSEETPEKTPEDSTPTEQIIFDNAPEPLEQNSKKQTHLVSL